MRRYDYQIIRSNRELNRKALRLLSVIKPTKSQRRKKKKKEREYRNRIPRSYKIYIKSKYWTERKNRYWQLYKKKCFICKSSNYVQLHHIIYKNYGFEEDKDLIPLCKNHHELFHDIYGVKRDMTNEVNQFIEEQSLLEDIGDKFKNL